MLDQGTSSDGMEEERMWVLQKDQGVADFRLAESGWSGATINLQTLTTVCTEETLHCTTENISED